MYMQRNSNTIVRIFGRGRSEKGEIPYYVDNLFYDSFGMSCDEVFEALKKSDFFEMN